MYICIHITANIPAPLATPPLPSLPAEAGSREGSTTVHTCLVTAGAIFRPDQYGCLWVWVWVWVCACMCICVCIHVRRCV